MVAYVPMLHGHELSGLGDEAVPGAPGLFMQLIPNFLKGASGEGGANTFLSFQKMQQQAQEHKTGLLVGMATGALLLGGVIYLLARK